VNTRAELAVIAARFESCKALTFRAGRILRADLVRCGGAPQNASTPGAV